MEVGPASIPARAPGLPTATPLLACLKVEVLRPLDLLSAEVAKLTAGDGPPAIRPRDLDVLSKMARSLTGLTTDYLDLAALRDDKPPTAPAPIPASRIAAAIDARISVEAAGLGISWSCRAEGGLGEVLVDAPRCLRLLLNLSREALAATPEGGEVELRFLPARGGAWEVLLRDGGAPHVSGASTPPDDPFSYRWREGDGHDGDAMGPALAIWLAEEAGAVVELDPLGPPPGASLRIGFPAEPPARQ